MEPPESCDDTIVTDITEEKANLREAAGLPREVVAREEQIHGAEDAVVQATHAALDLVLDDTADYLLEDAYFAVVSSFQEWLSFWFAPSRCRKAKLFVRVDGNACRDVWQFGQKLAVACRQVAANFRRPRDKTSSRRSSLLVRIGTLACRGVLQVCRSVP